MSVLKTRFAGRAAKLLRASATPAERLLWSRLRDRRLLGHKFVRQQPIGPYIADFACRDADLVVELDGGQHADEAASANDAQRSTVLAAHGYRVIRFWNNDVVRNLDDVLATIAASLEQAPSPGLRFAKSDPSPKGEVAGRTANGEET